jgi:hypothetical protein
VQRLSNQPPQLPWYDGTDAATPAKKNSGMIWKIQVSAWNTTDVVSRFSQCRTPSRMMLVAMTVCPMTTPTSAVMRMTSMARSRPAGVAAWISSTVGNAAMDIL